jgi:hypothetical protein
MSGIRPENINAKARYLADDGIAYVCFRRFN